MAAEDGNGRISVSEDRLRLVISEFKNEILEEVRKHATAQALEALESRVKALELWQAAIAATEKVRRGFSTAALAWTTLCVSSVGVVSTIIFFKFGG